ncbi:MAG: hypothetical protein HC788_04540 [Sphingopyxis sp.]|nr:hypothetical protein [Sphingopyxis sp.]
MMTNANAGQTIAWQANYDPFGNAVTVTAAPVNNQRLPGQWFQIARWFPAGGGGIRRAGQHTAIIISRILIPVKILVKLFTVEAIYVTVRRQRLNEQKTFYGSLFFRCLDLVAGHCCRAVWQ